MENDNTGLLQSLSTLGQLQIVDGLWFNQKSFSLDGYRFVGCRFDGCSLHVSTLNFELVNCHVDQKTVITYGPQTLKIVKLYNSRNDYAYNFLSVFAPAKNADGTITIIGT